MRWEFLSDESLNEVLQRKHELIEKLNDSEQIKIMNDECFDIEIELRERKEKLEKWKNKLTIHIMQKVKEVKF